MNKDDSAERAKAVFAYNLQRWMDKNKINQTDIVKTLGYKASTVSDWITGKKYPRVDKVQALADYFGILKSDLTEHKPPGDEKMQELREQLFNRPEMRILFSLSSKATKEDVEFVSEMLKKLTEKDE